MEAKVCKHSGDVPSPNPARRSQVLDSDAKGVSTHIQLEGLQHRPITSRDGGEQPQHFLDDTVQVVEAMDRVQVEGALTEATVVKDPVAPQLFAKLLEDAGMLQELHDERGAGAGRSGIGSKDQLQGAILESKGSHVLQA